MKTGLFWLSMGYWWSSRSLGLLMHPYVTMRTIVRERFMRPVVMLPTLMWLTAWAVGMAVGRIGMWLNLGRLKGAYEVGLGLGFSFLWVSVFLVIWQAVLLYLWARFGKVLKRAVFE